MARRNYSGAEQHQCQRPGSTAFLALPSRIGDRLHYRTEQSMSTVRTEVIA